MGVCVCTCVVMSPGRLCVFVYVQSRVQALGMYVRVCAHGRECGAWVCLCTCAVRSVGPGLCVHVCGQECEAWMYMCVCMCTRVGGMQGHDGAVCVSHVVTLWL